VAVAVHDRAELLLRELERRGAAAAVAAAAAAALDLLLSAA
jgi:hypothetical protein